MIPLLQIQHSTEMATTSYRPLLKLTKHPENIYLPLEHNYTLQEIAAIKKYLPKIYNFAGVDASSYQEQDKPAFDRQKLKLKAVNGNSIVDDRPLRFYKDRQLQTHEWRETYLWLDVPFNSKQDSDIAKEELESSLESYLKTRLVIMSKGNNKPVDINSKDSIEVKDVDLYFEPGEIQPQAFDREYRELRIKLPLALVTVKNHKYDAATLREIIIDDILHTLKIMIKNQMSIRVLKGSSGLILQSFVRQAHEEAVEESKLLALVEKKPQAKGQVDESVEEVGGGESGGAARQDPSNRTLLMVLIALAAIYIYLKLNPLQKSLNEM